MVEETTIIIEVGQPFPKKNEQMNFRGTKSGVEFKGVIWFMEIVGWSTKGIVGVELKVTVCIDEVTKKGKPNLKLLEGSLVRK